MAILGPYRWKEKCTVFFLSFKWKGRGRGEVFQAFCSVFSKYRDAKSIDALFPERRVQGQASLFFSFFFHSGMETGKRRPVLGKRP